MINIENKIPGAHNFRYKEFIKSDTATRRCIPNIPTPEHWQCIEKIAKKILQPVRRKFGPIRITSGYRSPDLCLAVGSSIHSNHTRGQAVDFEPVNNNIKLFDVADYIYHELPFRELIAEYWPTGWIHVAYRKGGNDRIVKLKDSTHNYTRMEWKDIRKIYS